MSDDLERRICDDAWSRVRRLAWMMAPAPALYVLVGCLLLRRGVAARFASRSVDAEHVLLLVFAAGVVACIAAAAWVAGRLKKTAPPASLSAAAQRWVAARVLALGLAALPAVLGLVYALLTGDLRRLLVPASVAMAVTLLLLPRRAALEAYVRRGGRSGDISS